MNSRIAPARWYRLIPIVFITYSLAYLDRANFGFAAAGEMAKDLHITAAVSSLLGSLFFLGYFFFQIPGAHYAANKSAKKLIFWSLILWGALAMATGFVSNIMLLIIIRFMLGVVESAVLPSMLILLSRWFTKAERSRANTFLILGNPVTILWMSILSGYLINSVGWRWMFIWEGLPAIVWAFLWWRLVNDKPANATWLTEEEKRSVESALQKEQQGINPVKNYAAAFKSKVVLLLCLQYALWSIGVYGFVIWLPSIIKAAPQMSIIKTGWLSSLPYAFAIIAMLTASYFSDKTLNRKIFVWPFLLVASLAFYSSYLVGTNNFWLSFALLVTAGAAMYAPYGPFFAIITEILPSNVTAGAIALINSFGALGSFTGSYFVGYLNGTTGGFGASYIFMAGALLCSAIITVIAVKEKMLFKNMKYQKPDVAHFKSNNMKKNFFLSILVFSLINMHATAQTTPAASTTQQTDEWFQKKEWLAGLQLQPHTTINKTAFARQYQINKTYWDEAFAFLKDNDLKTMAVGRYAIDSDNVYAMITENPTKDMDSTKWESHRNYIDLHTVINGEEKIGVADITKLTVTMPYDTSKDIVNYSGEGNFYVADPGTFFLFFPGDAHRPNITTNGNKPDKKIVIKIRYAK